MTSSYNPFFENSNVVSITLDQLNPDGSLRDTSSMADYNLKRGKVVIMFYADWCGACQQTKPNFKAFAKMVSKEKKNGVIAGGMNMSVADEVLIGRVKKFSYPISGYPTIVSFYNGQPYSIYRGDRTPEDLLAYAHDIGSKLKR